MSPEHNEEHRRSTAPTPHDVAQGHWGPGHSLDVAQIAEVAQAEGATAEEDEESGESGETQQDERHECQRHAPGALGAQARLLVAVPAVRASAACKGGGWSESARESWCRGEGVSETNEDCARDRDKAPALTENAAMTRRAERVSRCDVAVGGGGGEAAA